MDTALERHAERLSKRDRAMPKVPGLAAGQLSGEMSTGPNRLKAGKRSKSLSEATAHVSTSSKRFGVKPSSGAVSDLYRGQAVPGKDDGSAYFDDWRENGGAIPMPKPKTPKQDRLKRLCIAWIAGERTQELEAVIRASVLGIIHTDPDHGSAWRAALNAQGLRFN